METETLCPWCGAFSTRQCELEDEMGIGPWEESREDEVEIPGAEVGEQRVAS